MQKADFDYMQNARATLRTVTFGANIEQVVGPSHRRVALLFTAPAGGSVTLSTDPAVSAGIGLMLHAGGVPLELTLEKHGDIVQQPLYGISSVALTLAFVETIVTGTS